MVGVEVVVIRMAIAMSMATTPPSAAPRRLGLVPEARPIPHGWYVLAFSEELPDKKVLLRKLAGREVVLFRTESGVAQAVDPVCPHLGAHLGHGGAVVGESIRCPFHGFRFDVDGACVATGYDTKPPKTARLETYPTLERHGTILVWFDAARRPPSFAIPPLDMTGFTPLAHHTFTLRSTPEDTTENSVDTGHFSVVHGYSEIRIVKPLVVEGAYLTSRYGMYRPLKVLGLPLGVGVHAEFEVHVHGLGYSFVEVKVDRPPLESRTFVFATPIDAEHIELRIALAVKRFGVPAIERAALHAAFRSYRADVEQDFVIWNNKVRVERPALADGDGPIGRYRRWAQQFYT